MILIWLAAGVLGQVTDAPPVIETPEIITGGGGYNFLNPRKAKVAEEDDDSPSDRTPEIRRIGKAQSPVVVSGVVEIRKTARIPNVETLSRVERQRLKAEQKRQEQIRRQIAADDEWLMMA